MPTEEPGATPDTTSGDEDSQNPEQTEAPPRAQDGPGNEQAEGSAATGAETEPADNGDSAQLEQWLRQIPDEPGKLLQRKFEYQYRRQTRRPRDADQEDRY